jgi:glycosyltransferase involved in cell wall biosynthesis
MVPLPEFSIITPTYGAARYIRRCYWSLNQQCVQDWEWVVVDDCSTDDTEDVIRELGDMRIRYYRLPVNAGRGPARNHALGMARGDWAIMLDMDDFCFPERIAVARETKKSGYDFLCSALALIDEHYNVTGVRDVGASSGPYPLSFPHATLCGPTEILRKIGYPAYRRAQDQTMVLTIANSMNGLRWPEPLYVYDENANVTAKDALVGQICTFLQLGELVRRRVLTEGLPVRLAQLKCLMKAASLGPFVLHPQLYKKTLRLRANGAVARRGLSAESIRFVRKCAELFPGVSSRPSIKS